MEGPLASLWGLCTSRPGGARRGDRLGAPCRGRDTGTRPSRMTPQGGTQELSPRAHLLPSAAHSGQKPEGTCGGQGPRGCPRGTRRGWQRQTRNPALHGTLTPAPKSTALGQETGRAAPNTGRDTGEKGPPQGIPRVCGAREREHRVRSRGLGVQALAPRDPAR